MKLSEAKLFIFYASGVFVFYLLNGYIMETIFQQPEFALHGWFFTLIQYLCFVLMSFVQLCWSSTRNVSRQPSVLLVHSTSAQTAVTGKPFKMFIMPSKLLIWLSVLTLVTVSLSTVSVGYVNYPTQLLLKSCKIIPVMIGSIVIQGQRRYPLEFVGSIAMSIGMIAFTVADSKAMPNFNLKGIVMVLVALIADAVIGNLQERAMKHQKLNSVEIVYYSYAIGSILLTFALLWSGDIVTGVRHYYDKEPLRLSVLSLCFCATGYFGLLFLLKLIEVFGAFHAAIVTTSRKAVTIVLSFVLFAKPFTLLYLGSGCLVLSGIFACLTAKTEVARRICERISRLRWHKKTRSAHDKLMHHV